MLAARDQENLIYSRHQAAASKSLNQTSRGVQPKTPGDKYPKTPLKINLNDENRLAAISGGKSVLGTKGKGLENLVNGGKIGITLDKNGFITPMGPRNRAPLGMKTTNAKTKAIQTPAAPVIDKDPVKTHIKPSSARKPKPKVAHVETIKLNVHGDENGPLEEREPEYCPPKPTPLPYESDVFPDGCLDYNILKGPNLMHAWQGYYGSPVDENGVSLMEKQVKAEFAKAQKDAEDKVFKQIEEMDWTIRDVPEIFSNLHLKELGGQGKEMDDKHARQSSKSGSKGPATIASRKAASALSVAPNPTDVAANSSDAAKALSKGPYFPVRGRKMADPAVNPSLVRHSAATKISRSTIGYTKGRSASNVLKMNTRGLPQSTSNPSNRADTTTKPTSYSQKPGLESGSEDWQRLVFLGLVDRDEDDFEPSLNRILPDCLKRDEDAEEEFVMILPGIQV